MQVRRPVRLFNALERTALIQRTSLSYTPPACLQTTYIKPSSLLGAEIHLLADAQDSLLSVSSLNKFGLISELSACFLSLDLSSLGDEFQYTGTLGNSLNTLFKCFSGNLVVPRYPFSFLLWQRFSTGVPQEYLKHATPECLIRGTDLFSYRL